jgi:hypothetical protein
MVEVGVVTDYRGCQTVVVMAIVTGTCTFAATVERKAQSSFR